MKNAKRRLSREDAIKAAEAILRSEPRFRDSNLVRVASEFSVACEGLSPSSGARYTMTPTLDFLIPPYRAIYGVF